MQVKVTSGLCVARLLEIAAFFATVTSCDLVAASPPSVHRLSKFCTQTAMGALDGETDRSHREFRRIKDAMWSRRGASLAFIVLVFLSGLPSFSASQTRKEVRIGVVGVPASVDQGVGTDGTGPLVARHVFDTLVTYREGSTDIDAGLATRWSVSRDGLTWSFVLRDNARFHDGTPVTATDVAMSFGRFHRP